MLLPLARMTLIVSDSSGIKSQPFELEVYRAQASLPTVTIAYPSRSTIEYGLIVYLQATVKDSACSSITKDIRFIFNWEVAVFTEDGYGVELDGERVMKTGFTCLCLNGGGDPTLLCSGLTVPSSFFPHMCCPATTQELSLSRHRCEAGLCTDSLSQRTLRVVPRSKGMALYILEEGGRIM